MGSNYMKINNVEGYFNCRVWQKDVPMNNRKMVQQGERINFSCGFAEEFIPDGIKEFAKKSEKSGLFYVQMKVFPKNCKLYTASAKLIQFPDYSKIDGGKFQVNMDVTFKHGTGTELNGVYVNAMQIIRRADNPFDAVEGNDDFEQPIISAFDEPDQPTVPDAGNLPF